MAWKKRKLLPTSGATRRKSAADEAAARARHGLRTGSKNLLSAEELVLGHVRSNTNLYLFAALLLVGSRRGQAARSLSREETSQAPLL